MSSQTRRLKLRRPDTCANCARDLPAGEIAIWDRERREARCVACEPADAVRESTAGGSARRVYERRRDRRESGTREKWGVLGGVAVALSTTPQHERAWARGAEGEERLAEILNSRTAEHGVVLLHDRRFPGGRANIDHLAVSRCGVFVIDAKRYTGRIAVERRGGLLSPRTSHLIIGGRDKTKLVDGVLGQAEVVRTVLVAAGQETVPVQPVLAFIDGELPLLGRLEVRGVPILGPRQTAKLCCGEGSISPAMVEQIAGELARRLPAA